MIIAKIIFGVICFFSGVATTLSLILYLALVDIHKNK